MTAPFPGSQFSLPRGRRLRRALISDPEQEYLLYVPHTLRPHAPLLVSLHGISRNAHEHARVFTSLCEEHGVLLLVPVFTEDLHKDYQRLGRRGRGNRIDLLLHSIFVEVKHLCGADVSQVYFFGFSAGAQLAHRYAMAHPHRVARVVAAAAGWYSFPDTTQKFPYGIRPTRDLEGVTFDPEAFLHVPMEVLVGQKDTGTKHLRSTERTVKQQGVTRLDRARNWVAAMQAAAEAHEIEPQVTLTEVAGVGHSFEAFCEKADLVKRVGASLFAHLPPLPEPEVPASAEVSKAPAVNGRAQVAATAASPLNAS